MHALLAVPLAALSLVPARDEPVDIARLSPAGSWAFVTIPDWPRLVEAARASGLEALWKEPAVRAFVDRLFEEEWKDLSEALGAIDAKMEDLVEPAGGVGAALFDAADPGAEAPHLIVAADFGERADAAQALLDKAIDRGVDLGRIEFNQADYGRARVVTITVVREEEPEPPAEPEGEEDEFEFEDEPAPGLLDSHDEYYLARLGGAFVASSDRATLESALDALAGGDIDSLADADGYAGTLAQHGESPLACAALMVQPLLASMAEEAAGTGFLPPDADMTAVLRALGVDEVRSVSVGLGAGEGDVAARQTTGILVPEKRGLAALFDFPDAPLDPPAFVGPDAAAFSRFKFNFAGVLPLVRAVVATLPEQTRGFIEQSVEQAAGMGGPLLETMGPDLFVTTSYATPLNEESQRQVIAIPLRDPLILGNLLTAFAGEVLDATDFQGHTIYRPKEGGLAGPSVGVGFGHAFFGPAEGVEALMRNAANPGGPRLADEPRFRRAAAAAGGDAPFVMYSETEPELRWLHWQAQNTPAEEDPAFDPFDPLAALRDKLPPVEVLTRHLGDTIFSMRSAPDGFRGTLLWLRPPRD